MPANKLHHYVPQFYLRNFAGSNGRAVALFNIAKSLHIPHAPIDRQCAKDYLYGKDLSVEKAFSLLEHRSAGAIRNVLSSGRPPDTGSADELVLLEFLVFQRARTPAAANVVIALSKEMDRRLSDDRLSSAIARSFEDPIGYSLQFCEKMVPMVADLEAMVLANTTPIEFITSDAPVVVHNQWCQQIDGIGTVGFACAGLQIFLPISPRILILFFDNQIYRLPRARGRVVLLDTIDDVEHLNALQLNVADLNLYHSGDVATKESIDRLPLHRHRPRHELLRSTLAKSDDDASRELIHFYDGPPAVRLKSSFMEIAKPYRELPVVRRVQRWRGKSIKARGVPPRRTDERDRHSRRFTIIQE